MGQPALSRSIKPTLFLERSYLWIGVAGRLKLLNGLTVHTLERPWCNNEPFFSCIPEGLYVCRRIVSPKFGPTFEVSCVDGRSHILFHKLNTVHETRGCIGVGTRISVSDNELFLERSGDGFDVFMASLLGINEFYLDVSVLTPHDMKVLGR